MDLSGVEQFIPNIAKWLKLDPATVLFLLFVLTKGSNIISRLIPASATGWIGVVRHVASVIGIDVSKRVAPGVTVNEVAKVAAVQSGLTEPPVEEEEPAFSRVDPIESYLDAVRGGDELK